MWLHSLSSLFMFSWPLVSLALLSTKVL
jgi:hypothetical protein